MPPLAVPVSFLLLFVPPLFPNYSSSRPQAPCIIMISLAMVVAVRHRIPSLDAHSATCLFTSLHPLVLRRYRLCTPAPDRPAAKRLPRLRLRYTVSSFDASYLAQARERARPNTIPLRYSATTQIHVRILSPRLLQRKHCGVS